MEIPKIVDDLRVTMKYQVEESPRTCFIVFSSREEHVEVVIDCIDIVFDKIQKYKVVRLDQHLKSGDSQFTELTDLLNTCCFAIIILDGFRPNVLFEYGVLKGLGKPCIVLLEENATADIQGFFTDQDKVSVSAPAIDIDKHFSDVKDRFYVRYNRNKPKEIRATLQAEFTKHKKQIENEFLNILFPHWDIVEKEITQHLETIVNIFNKHEDSSGENDIVSIDTANSHIVRIANENNISLPNRYFSTIAHSYEKAGDPQKALALIDSTLKGISDDVPLLSDKAFILRSSGNFKDALKSLDAGIKLRPKAEFLWHNKAITLDMLDKEEEAEQCFKKAIALKSGCTLVHYHYGVLLYNKNDFKLALEEFNKALKNQPDEPKYLLWKARSLDGLGSKEEARQIIDGLVSSEPSDADVWFVMGSMEEDETKSFEFFQKAVQLDPNHGGALCSSAAHLSNQGRLDEAIIIFSDMQNFCPRHEICKTLTTNICTTLIRLERYDDGIKICNKMLEKQPDHDGALHSKAMCLARKGKNSLSLEIFSRLLNKSPKDADLWYDQACTYVLAKKSREAVQSLQKSIALNPKYKTTVLSDADFDPIRRTKVFREAIVTQVKTVHKKTKKPTSRTRKKND